MLLLALKRCLNHYNKSINMNLVGYVVEKAEPKSHLQIKFLSRLIGVLLSQTNQVK